MQYLVLLRGINVGGKNPVKMAELRECFEQMGLDDVATYIQSGNVLFRAPRRSAEELSAQIETALTERFGYASRVVVVSQAQLRVVVENAPRGFGTADRLNDVIFLRKPLTARGAMAVVQTREGVDEAYAGKGVLYFSRLAAKRTQSRLSKIVGLPQYQDMTIRSWRTTTKLLAMMDER